MTRWPTSTTLLHYSTCLGGCTSVCHQLRPGRHLQRWFLLIRMHRSGRLELQFLATVDNGTCIFVGCLDPAADNYNPDAAFDNGSCQYLGAWMRRRSTSTPRPTPMTGPASTRLHQPRCHELRRRGQPRRRQLHRSGLHERHGVQLQPGGHAGQRHL